ncbi:MAG: hypothetical protein ACPK85_16665 [Methanosarcina sp.]
MTMNAVQLIEANTYNVSNAKKALSIFYTRAGPHGIPSKLTIEWQNCKRNFEGNEITESKVQELDMVTVDVSKHIPGAPLICLSLLLPKVNLNGPEGAESVATFCIKTTRKSGSIGPEYHIGQDDSYEIIELNGKAMLLLK